MSASRRLLLVYALLAAAQVAVIYLPGNPSPGPGQPFWIAVDAVIVLGLARGSRLAWWTAVFFSSLGAGLSLMLPWQPSVGIAATAAISIAQLVLLIRGPLNDGVWNRAPAPG